MHEGRKPRRQHRDADRLGGDRILAHRAIAPAGGRIDDAGEHHQRHDEPADRPGQRRLQRHAGEGAGAAGEVDGVDQHDIDDDQEAERRHRRRNSPKAASAARRRGGPATTQSRPATSVAGRKGSVIDGQPVRQVGQIGMLGRGRQRQDARGIGADGDEADMAEREDAGEAVADPQRRRPGWR